MEELTTSLLGYSAATALELAARLDVGSPDSEEAVKIEFPKLFSGRGKIQGEYNIGMNPGAKLFSLCTPRHIPLPLLPQVKEELNHME